MTCGRFSLPVDAFSLPMDAFYYLWTIFTTCGRFSLPVDAFLYLWTLFTTCGRFSLPMDAFHYLWALFTSYELILISYQLLFGRDGLPNGVLGDGCGSIVERRRTL
jgi:hypothetical protein